MCMFQQPVQAAAPTLPAQSAAAKAPNQAQAQSAGTRAAGVVQSAAPTILTSPSGVIDFADTQKKTLLGS